MRHPSASGPTPVQPRLKKALSALLLLAAIAAVFVISRHGWEEQHHSSSDTSALISAVPSQATLEDPLPDAIASLQRGTSPDDARGHLSVLRQRLKAMPPERAVAFIRAYLDKGGNVATGLEFGLGRDRRLRGWSSLRVFLIDLLEDLSPAAAVSMSRRILDRPTDADEWAAAMKNIGRHSEADEDIDLLAAKAREMLGRETWRRDPSVGYLEAFDVIVHTRDASFVSPLLDRCGDRRNGAVRHASFLALDRLVQNTPEQALASLVALSAVHSESPEMIANMVARADVRSPVQRRAVETYLLDPRRTPVELASFASVFPNGNQMVSVNLVTTGDVVAGTDFEEVDRASLKLVQDWLEDPRFRNLRPFLQTMQSRIGAFVR